MTIERVTTADAEALLTIYAPYVRDTAVSFEYEVPSVEAFRERIRTISEKYPYIKAVDDTGEILGYAYAGTFKGRSAYDFAVETTIYLREDMSRIGIGRKLYEALEQSLRSMGIRNMDACIAAPMGEDEYLTEDSIRFHEKMGFTLVGRFHGIGYKFGHWYDMVWMEKHILPHDEAPQVHFGQWEI